MAVTSATAASVATATDATATGRSRLAHNFDTFLTLLTTQMKNQDPLAPLDSNQFTAQLVQMTGVEQQLATNDLLKQLVANSGTNIASAVDLIGKQVRVDSADSRLSGGKAQWSYHLDADTSDLKFEVLDAKGATVNVFSPSREDSTAGDHSFTWDGRNMNGQSLPDGTYSLRITTRSASGESVAVGKVFLEGPVSGVEQSNGQSLITVNGAKALLSQVISVTQPTPPSSTSASSGSTSTNATDQTSDQAA